MLLSDRQIEKLCTDGNKMIDPFRIMDTPKTSISSGLSAYGYDITLGSEFWQYSGGEVIDPKRIKNSVIVTHEFKRFKIEPHDFVLAESLEYFKIPRDIFAICVGKSTYARCGLILNVTPLEPEWEGYLTLELSNTLNQPVYVYPNEGIGQLLFFRAQVPCEMSYKDKKGIYQSQNGITLPKVR